MRRRGTIFGIILILLGGFFLLSELGVLDGIYAQYNITAGSIATGIFNAVTTLWPLILVALGVTILVRNDWVSRIVWLVVIAAMVVYAIASPAWMPHRGMMWFWSDNWNDEQGFGDNRRAYAESIDYTAQMKRGSVDIALGAGSTIIESGTKAAVIEGKGRPIRFDWQVDDDTLDIEIESRDDFGSFNDFGGEQKIALGKELLWEISIDTGASDFKCDLRDLKVEKIDFSVGAGSVELHLGALLPETRVEMDAGASSIVLYVPEETGVALESESGLSSVTLDGNDLSTIGSGSYRSDNYAGAENKVEILLSSGVSSVEIIRE